MQARITFEMFDDAGIPARNETKTQIDITSGPAGAEIWLDRLYRFVRDKIKAEDEQRDLVTRVVYKITHSVDGQAIEGE